MIHSKYPKSEVSHIAIAMSSLALLATAMPAQAQVDEIITTAQRQVQDLQDVPIAVTAFTPEALEERQIDEPIDLIQYVPNLYGGNNTGLGTANVYYIRGQGNTESIATFDPPVGTYVDEVYIGRQNANNIGFFDVEGIEVLRGPQGTLFGRNTTGGAIVTRMKKPSEEGGGFVEIGYGSYNRYLARGSVDLAFSDTVLTKFSAYLVDDEGYVDNLATGEKLNGQSALGLRGDIRLMLADNVRWDFAIDYTEDDGTSILNYSRGGSPLTGVDGDSDRVSNTGILTESGTGTLLEQLLSGRGLGNDNESISVTSNIEWGLGDGTVNLIAGYRTLDQNFILDFFDGGLGGQQFITGGFAIANAGEHDQHSLELKYSNSYFDGNLDIISGLYYFNEDNNTDFADVFTISLPFGPFPITLADRVIDNTLNTYAAYVQGDYHLSDRLTLTAGARWTEEVKEIDIDDKVAEGQPGDGTLDTEDLNFFGIGTKQTKALLTPRVALNYEFSDNASAYVSATNGFKSGGWNARGTSGDQIVPFGREKVWNYEAGLRSVLADNTIRFNATAFLMDVSDVQIPSAFTTATGQIVFITRNFADLETKGIEADLTYSPTSNLNLYAAAGFQDAEYKSIPQVALDQQAGCVASPTNAGGGQGIITPNCDIADPVRAPDYSVTVGGSYDFDLSNGWQLTPSANVRLVGETHTGTNNVESGFENGYTLVNAGLTLSSNDEKGWSAVIECKNCFDESYITNVLAGTPYSSDPVRWHVGLRKDF